MVGARQKEGRGRRVRWDRDRGSREGNYLLSVYPVVSFSASLPSSLAGVRGYEGRGAMHQAVLRMERTPSTVVRDVDGGNGEEGGEEGLQGERGEGAGEGRGGKRQTAKKGEHTLVKCMILWQDEFQERPPPITHPSVSQSQWRETSWHDPTWHCVCCLPGASRPYTVFAPVSRLHPCPTPCPFHTLSSLHVPARVQLVGGQLVVKFTGWMAS